MESSIYLARVIRYRRSGVRWVIEVPKPEFNCISKFVSMGLGTREYSFTCRDEDFDLCYISSSFIFAGLSSI